MTRLAEQTALVSGGASGLGLAIVSRFVDEGASVVVLDRSAEDCAALEARFAGRVICSVGDVRSLADNEAAVAVALERFGGLDTVIGNAGIWDYNATLAATEGDDLGPAFDELFRINVLGYLNLAKAALVPLTQSRGAVVFTVSNAGFLAGGGGPLYTASKHAVVGLVRQLAFELAPHVRVNGVAPGPIATRLRGPEALGMAEAEFPGESIRERAGGFVPVGRLPSPEEYAGAYVFFASREDNFPATGTVLNHDGGFAVRGLGRNPRGGDDLLEQLGVD